MTVRRSSYTPKNVLRFLLIFDRLLDQVKSKHITGGFIKYTDYADMKPTTLQNRITDALKWLMDNSDNPAQIAKLQPMVLKHKSDDYKLLRLIMKTRTEHQGIRLTIMAGITPDVFIRDAVDVGPTQTARDWKIVLASFLQDSSQKVTNINNCSVTPADEAWLASVTKEAGVEYMLVGDKLTLMKP